MKETDVKDLAKLLISATRTPTGDLSKEEDQILCTKERQSEANITFGKPSS
jgi:hypothetical protein